MIENLKIGDLFLLLSIFQLYYLLISMFFEFINGKIESHFMFFLDGKRDFLL